MRRMGNMEPMVDSHWESFSYPSSKSPGGAPATTVLKLPGSTKNKHRDLDRENARKGMTLQPSPRRRVLGVDLCSMSCLYILAKDYFM